MHIVGTAGHVDHGKSALVQALTGTNPDRWLEEQLRGMTLDLGFAHLRIDDDLDAGIVDVPGHERFLHNMLAGAAGMELLLLVVAANEGPEPQTFEHLAILQYLNVRRTILVVTKIDLLDPAEVPAAVASIQQALQETLARDAPAIAVSAHTGAGLTELRDVIRSELRRLPPRNAQAPAYLPIDRVFALPGHGTIVTGTLMQGTVAVGDRLMLAPSGKKARVRSLQVFGASKPTVDGGSRVAANLPSVEVDEIGRGEVLASPQFEIRNTFEVTFAPLIAALPLLRRRNPVRAYVGSAELLGTLVFERVPNDDATYPARLYLQRATIAYPGASYILRRLSPKTLLGGGKIQQSTSAVAMIALEGRPPQSEAVLSVLRSAGLEPLEISKIAEQANLREQVVQEALDRLVETDHVLRVARPPAYVDAARAEEFLRSALDALEKQTHAEPWSMGATSLALARALGVAEPLLVRLLSPFVEDGKLAYRSGYFAPLDHVPKLTSEQRAFFEREIPADPQSPFTPASLPTVLARMRAMRLDGLSKAFDTLVVKGALVKVGDDLYRGTQIAQIHAKVEQLLRTHDQMTMAEFRDVLGTSRKYAVPLLEWFDAHGITVRSGDIRRLRLPSGRAGGHNRSL